VTPPPRAARGYGVGNFHLSWGGGRPVRADLGGWNESLLRKGTAGLEIREFRSEVVKAFSRIWGFDDDLS
jgi:hypothetical protein